ncbi:hypothetical protein AYI70_g6693 [Smittium culicis]|uniref:Uncharacterized protein n=1 Tax=Smittium culicis TaxID=133412 RepID=A0A1R1X1F0_9FUNG|nr:hypothetical protein AYI70_g11544 [Smittium culicis]OMJ16315.1 hypothetical protein AYI70_g6693 [Smittium culicis]
MSVSDKILIDQDKAAPTTMTVGISDCYISGTNNRTSDPDCLSILTYLQLTNSSWGIKVTNETDFIYGEKYPFVQDDPEICEFGFRDSISHIKKQVMS